MTPFSRFNRVSGFLNPQVQRLFIIQFTVLLASFAVCTGVFADSASQRAETQHHTLRSTLGVFGSKHVEARSTIGVQKPGLVQSTLAKARRNEVKEVFASAFADYMKFGYPYDEVRPVIKRGRNTRNGWSATLVDSLDTLFVMGLQEEFNQGVSKTLKIDFSRSQTNDTIALFETTIRYLGGMLSAYELSGSKNQALLKQARELGDRLLIAWPNDQQALPFPQLDFGRQKPVFDKDKNASNTEIVIAEAGSLILEMERLSFYTQDPKYLRHATKAMQAIMNSPSPLPGLAPFSLGVQSQKVTNDRVTWSGGADSYYEYLLKYGILSNNRDKSYINAWKLAVEASKQHLIQVSPVHNLTYLASFSSEKGIDHEFTHLACFAGGNWLLGARVLNDPSTFRYGLRLIETCMETYKRTATRLGPETFRFLAPGTKQSSDEQPSLEDVNFFNKNGFYIDNKSFKLRPEVVESAFYAWRLTGDTRYQDFVWDAFKALQKHCKAPASFSAISDVNSVPTEHTDNSESFLYAETFKYIYLTFADPNLLSLDEYVFTTEAHPFRVTKDGH